MDNGTMRSMIDRRLITAAVFAALPALGGCISSTTYGTGQAPELAVFSEVAGGLTGARKDKEPINYQPRAPLVMPPDGQLQQPIDTASTEGGPWPSTSDAASDLDASDDDDIARNDITPEYARRLRPLAGLLPASSDDQTGSGNDNRDSINRKYETIRNPNQAKQFKADLAEAKGLNTTKRRYLTDPPEGYRTPAESAPTEFDEIDKKGEKKNFFTRLWPF
jgi:hypothetical protein